MPEPSPSLLKKRYDKLIRKFSKMLEFNHNLRMRLEAENAALRQACRRIVDDYDVCNRALHEEHLDQIPDTPLIAQCRAALQEPSHDA